MPNWNEFRNTYLQLPWLFPLVIRDRHYDRVLKSRPRTFTDNVQRALEKLLWFWPRVIDATPWAAGSIGKPQTPLNYTTIDQDARVLLEWVERVSPDRNAPILDLGCNCGRHIVHLAERGYQKVTGVDAMGAAIALFAERSPEVFREREIHHDLFQRFLLSQPDGRFELTYSHGATIEMVHPSFDIVAHLCRVTRRHICLILHERDAFPRDWLTQFAKKGFVLLHGERPMSPDSRASLIILRRCET
jgi:SAM-dependent methyltransferase